MKDTQIEYRPRLSQDEYLFIQGLRKYKQNYTEATVKPLYEPSTGAEPLMYEKGKSRVLVIGDLHAPFDLPKYLDHCKKVYRDFECDTVVFIGDIIDAHFSSYHEPDANGMGAKNELDLAIEHVARYRDTFPKSKVCVGNHDRMAFRKANTGGLPKQWIKSYQEVLNVPEWDFVTSIEIDGVQYVHGEGGGARPRMKHDHVSLVQGHRHTDCYIDWTYGRNHRLFAMQCGTGIDFDQYAFAYAKAGKKPAVSCGVVLNGSQPFLIPMNL